MNQTLTHDLALTLQIPIRDADRARAAIHLLDWAGCGLAATREDVAIKLSALADATVSGPCSVIGGTETDLLGAISVNAGLGNVLEIDDVHRGAIVHPGDTVIPVALALAEQYDLSGSALLDAIIVGYETTIRVGLAAGTGHYRHWYTTATCGVFGAAAAAGRLMDLSQTQLVDALGHAGMMSAGLWQCREELTDSKQIATVHAATSGLLAARFAASGGRGPTRILEGKLGFFAAACPYPKPEQITAAAAGWKIHEVSFKPWPACRHVHPTIEAALVLKAKISDLGSIDTVKVETYRDAVSFADNPAPDTPHAARFSLQHCTAAAFIDGTIGLEHSAAQALSDPAISVMRAKVEVAEAADITAKYPSLFGSRMTVVLKSGERISHEVESAKGDPENPMTTGEIEGKARSLVTSAFNAELAESLIRAATGVASGQARAFGSILRQQNPASSDGRPKLFA